ncbi:UdgX family uracil-DNA binding protein [Chelativorans sp. SCAU2101]|uniref:Type-4 uracil-DNA glycosylase n=1 Tax=Chelativorans petroleitrophicus TaxID=2975484 RepID=A0A9X2X803_9HYPH|nr:UdgX family uracil-DNA binding protein [Chelativorans petroleitrophicus]MCT8989789.1 UdgX family uracil-DNA binding protein [Chelativorans petroleitrophicus]
MSAWKQNRQRTLEALRQEAEGCTRCDLYKNATQTVFGEGRSGARVVFVGEQPGDREDIEGRPFVGPAGRLFDAVLEDVGIDRKKTYVTNAVKHFKFEPRGKRRIHSKPNAGEIRACRWWLDQELALIRPDVAVALGATAARALTGKPVSVMKLRGTVVSSTEGLPVFITVHPSSLLRVPDEADRRRARELFAEDMRKVKAMMKG